MQTAVDIDISKRYFLKVGGIAGLGALTLGTTACPGSEKVSIYTQTISSFLNEIASLVPAQAAFIARIIKVAADFDAAYRRGDLENASAFFNTMVANVTTLFNDIGVNVSAQMKVGLAIVSSTVKLIAVLLKDQGAAAPAAVAKARGASKSVAKSANAIERLANAASIEALYQAAKP